MFFLDYFRKPKFPIALFVVSSLLTFIVLGIFYLLFFVLYSNSTSRLSTAPVNGSFGEYYSLARSLDQDYLNGGYRSDDPYLTKNPDVQDLIVGPIISEKDPALGVDKAAVTIVEFSDFECGFCKAQEEKIKKMIDKYEGKIKLIWKDYPQNNPETISFKAAVAARCAGEQGKFWPYHDLLFENNNNLNERTFTRIAKFLELDTDRFNKCLTEQATKNSVLDNIFEANSLDINGVPFIFVNDQEIMGELDIEALENMVKTELGSI